MPEIVVTEFMDQAAMDDLAADFDLLYDPDLAERPDTIAERIADASALIVRNRTQVTASLLDAGPELVAVGRLGVGLDNIDVSACADRDISVHHASGANSVSVAEYVMSAMLALLRPVFSASRDLVDGAWPRTQLVGGELSGRVLGLVGFGAIAQEIARRALAFGMTVQAHDPYVAADDPAWGEVANVSQDAVLSGSDTISLHVPLTDETRGSINDAALAAMRPGAVLINTARGGIVDENALIAALRSGQLGGAALDVFEVEPIQDPKRFADVPNLILTPHIAGLTVESQQRVGTVVAAAVRRTLEAQ